MDPVRHTFHASDRRDPSMRAEGSLAIEDRNEFSISDGKFVSGVFNELLTLFEMNPNVGIEQIFIGKNAVTIAKNYKVDPKKYTTGRAFFYTRKRDKNSVTGFKFVGYNKLRNTVDVIGEEW